MLSSLSSPSILPNVLDVPGRMYFRLKAPGGPALALAAPNTLKDDSTVNLDKLDLSLSLVVGRTPLKAVVFDRGEFKIDSVGVEGRESSSPMVTPSSAWFNCDSKWFMISSRSFSNSWILSVSSGHAVKAAGTDEWCMSESCRIASARAFSVLISFSSSSALAFDFSVATGHQFLEFPTCGQRENTAHCLKDAWLLAFPAQSSS